MGAEDSQESELDVGGARSGAGEAALPIGAERDHLEVGRAIDARLRPHPLQAGVRAQRLSRHPHTG